jgi:hypothetical protein
MIISSLLLALVGSLSVGRAGGYPGPGRMMGPGGMMGQGYGAPGFRAAGDVGSLPEAREAVEQAIQSYGNPDLGVAEVMEFSNNYYAEVREKDTGIGAMELLVDKGSGQVYPEPGPNMMWNAKYGMMAGGRGMGGMMGQGGMMGGQPFQRNAGSATGTDMTVSPERAREIANDYLGRVSPGTEAGEAERFYGYYTLHTEKDGEITGMLSVNGYSGEVWYHSWHGPFIAMEEED